MESRAKTTPLVRVTAVLTRADLKIVDQAAAEAGVSREEALKQLLRYELARCPVTVH